MKNVLLQRLSIISPELSNRCRLHSFEDIISEYLILTTTEKSNSHGKFKNNLKCNCCKIAGHEDEDCRKKKKPYTYQSRGSSQKIILSLDKVNDVSVG